ncbi:hypothetical protein [Modicisalibacter luteus]|uniref:DUF3108 domain-containing protein n=1 Tax=Modicisalibacter luteus TaxID=453962 RepID=A0ABV7M076_9GAMM|nr:hypothetical protein [Halomonas lutea]GHA96368.1 hypothetical protein GCM10007159_17620 [Halomonas lutea]
MARPQCRFLLAQDLFRTIGPWLLLMACLTLSSLAHASPTPFQASYALRIDGWPEATISHTLSKHGATWESEMQVAIAIAEGSERSRFRVQEKTIDPLQFVSGYRMLGLGKRYSLSAEDMRALPDRQAALFELSRQVRSARCTHPQVSPCTIRYLDHKGDEETLDYRIVAHPDVTLPVGAFPGIRIDAWDPRKRDRHLIMTFHADIPGLLLGMEYQRDGETTSRLTLTRLALTADD